MIVNNSNNQDSPCFCKWDKCGLHLNKSELAKHVTNHMVPGPQGLFYCKWKSCTRGDRAFNAKYKMLIHLRTHTNDKPYQCYTCGKSFTRTENLKIHARTHTGEKPYVCSVNGCNKAYSNSSDRFKHTRTHFIEKPYACRVEKCMKRYTDPSSLRKHARSHNQQTRTITSQETNLQPSGDLTTSTILVDQPLDLSVRWKKYL